jgi:polyisoprenyl-phosphate glycosyltransferase
LCQKEQKRASAEPLFPFPSRVIMTAFIEISLIIPVFNEAGNIMPLHSRTGPILDNLSPHWEMIFIDDGSHDDTLQRIKALSATDPRVKAVSFSRNFGKEIAIAAGLDHAGGQAIIIMDADLQHPPEMIVSFVEKWREGYAMVYGQRVDRHDETAVKRGFAHLFYKLFDRFSEMHLPEGAGDFRLIDRKGIRVLQTLRERARFSKGLYAWIGFKATGVPFVVEERQSGATKWSFRRLFRFAFDGITSFSTVPLRIWTYLGVLISCMAILTALIFLVRTLLYGSDVPGFPSLFVSVMFFSGIQLLSLGIIGEYVGRIFAEVKRRPLYVVEERIGALSSALTQPVPDDRAL